MILRTLIAAILILPLNAAGQNVDFGNDSGNYPNDGECDDPRFTGPGAYSDPLEEDAFRDASDCQALFDSGQVWLASTSPDISIVDKDLDDPEERFAFHVLCAAITLLTAQEMTRTNLEAEAADISQVMTPLLVDTGRLHAQRARNLGGVDDDVIQAMLFVRLLNNGNVLPLEERLSFIAEHCLLDEAL